MFESPHQPVEHLPHLRQLTGKGQVIAAGDGAEVTRGYEMIFELAQRAQCDTQEPRKTDFGSLFPAFDDVRRDGHRGANDLTAEGCEVSSPNARRSAMSVDRERMGLSPHLQLPVITHARTLRCAVSRRRITSMPQQSFCHSSAVDGQHRLQLIGRRLPASSSQLFRSQFQL